MGGGGPPLPLKKKKKQCKALSETTSTPPREISPENAPNIPSAMLESQFPPVLPLRSEARFSPPLSPSLSLFSSGQHRRSIQMTISYPTKPPPAHPRSCPRDSQLQSPQGWIPCCVMEGPKYGESPLTKKKTNNK